MGKDWHSKQEESALRHRGVRLKFQAECTVQVLGVNWQLYESKLNEEAALPV